MNIVIVGGGTAGWLAAYSISRALNFKHNITLIESDVIPIVGAGEGTTGLFSDLITGTFFPTPDLNVEEFIEETSSTPKYGVIHENWTGDGSWYMSSISATLTGTGIPDSIFLHGLATNPRNVHLTSPHGVMYSQKVNGYMGAYHFDAFKVGAYFKKLCAEHPRTTHITSTVQQINKDEQGYIKSLELANGTTICGDFFIDCSGFARVLMNDLNVKWHSYGDELLVNSALPFFLPHNNDFDPVTHATALSAGWMWKIPTQERYGCGYVYSDKHINEDQAIKEIEDHLGHPITPLRKSIKFTAGRLDKLWEKNCLALGLAGAFAEPLEATSIHTTVAQLVYFIFEFLNDPAESVRDSYRSDLYNQNISKLYDDIRDFLVLHYSGNRNDSAFWRDVQNAVKSNRVQMILRTCELGSVPTVYTIDQHMIGGIGAGLYNWTLAGLGKIGKEQAFNQLVKYNAVESAKLQTDDFLTKMVNVAQQMKPSTV